MPKANLFAESQYKKLILIRIMNNYPRKQLRELIDRYDISLLDDKRRFKALLLDICNDCKKEINILLYALDDGIADDLANLKDTLPVEYGIRRFSRKLEENHGMTGESAYWAVESWAFAIGLIDEEIPGSGDEKKDGEPAHEKTGLVQNDKKKCLVQDVFLIKERFMSAYPHVKGKELIIDDDLNWIEFKRFPLPDYFLAENGQKTFYQPLHENILIVTDEYPAHEPLGIFVHRNSRNYSKIKFALCSNSQVKPPGKYGLEIKDLEDKGWQWVPFFYDENWVFDTPEIVSGSSIFSYIRKLFSALGKNQV